jgi:hypothetical protein
VRPHAHAVRRPSRGRAHVIAERPRSRTINVGPDLHKESVTAAVLPAGAPAPDRIEALRNDPAKLRPYVDFTRALYHLRWHAERAFSRHKRRLGFALTARQPHAQRREPRDDAVTAWRAASVCGG